MSSIGGTVISQGFFTLLETRQESLLVSQVLTRQRQSKYFTLYQSKGNTLYCDMYFLMAKTKYNVLLHHAVSTS